MTAPQRPASVPGQWVPANQARWAAECAIHDLRHTNASLLLLNGENPKVVSERLGHSRVQITLDLYAHVSRVFRNKPQSGWTHY